MGRSAFGAFARFVLFGGGVGLAASLAVPVVATLIPWAAANALITVASTVLGTELHARFTFSAGRRARWHQHLQSAGSATTAYLVTSAAILVLHVVQPSAGIRWEQVVYLGASGLAGAGRFLVLRRYVFAHGRTRDPDLDDPRPVRAAGGRAQPALRSVRRIIHRSAPRATAVRPPSFRQVDLTSGRPDVRLGAMTPDEAERRFTLLTAAARFDDLRRRDALAPPGLDDPDRQAEPLSRDEALELLALGEVLIRKAGYGRQLSVRTARANGASWSQVGAALGTTKQSAWETHLRWVEEQANPEA